MRKLLTVAALAALNSACALTNYPIITDEDQVRQANGTHIVNTTGRAFVMQKVQVASFVGDTTFNTVWFTNQDQKGNQTLWTHENIGRATRERFEIDAREIQSGHCPSLDAANDMCRESAPHPPSAPSPLCEGEKATQFNAV